MKTRIYLPVLRSEHWPLVTEYFSRLPEDWEKWVSTTFAVEVVTPVNHTVSPQAPPLLHAILDASTLKVTRVLFASTDRPVEQIVQLEKLWRESPGCKCCTVEAAPAWPLVLDGWGCQSDMLRGVAGRIQNAIEDRLSLTRWAADWADWQAGLLRDVVWPRLKPWGCAVLP